MPVLKVAGKPGELKNLLSPDYGTTAIPSGPVPPDFGIPQDNTPSSDQGKRDTWQQLLVQLKDVPFPQAVNLGMCLVFRPLVNSEGSITSYSVAWEWPSRLSTARSFEIIGAVEAEPVEFDGTGNVEFITTTTQPQDGKVYGRINQEWQEIQSVVIPPEAVTTLPPVESIDNNAFIEYRGSSAVQLDLAVTDEVEEFTIYAQGNAIEFTGDVIASASGGLVVPHGAMASVKKLSTGEYLVFGDTAIS